MAKVHIESAFVGLRAVTCAPNRVTRKGTAQQRGPYSGLRVRDDVQKEGG